MDLYNKKFYHSEFRATTHNIVPCAMESEAFLRLVSRWNDIITHNNVRIILTIDKKLNETARYFPKLGEFVTSFPSLSTQTHIIVSKDFQFEALLR